MKWYEELYALVDRKDMDAVGEWFADDVVLTMGNSEPVVGRHAVVEGLRQFQSTLAGLEHTFVAVSSAGDLTMLETRTAFHLWSGGSVELGGVTVIERRGELITAQRMYVDMAPLWAAQASSEKAASPAAT